MMQSPSTSIRACLRLGLVDWRLPNRPRQAGEDRLMMDAENSAARSHHHPFEIELAGLFLGAVSLLTRRSI